MKKIVIVEKKDDTGRVYIQHSDKETNIRHKNGWWNVFCLIDKKHQNQKNYENNSLYLAIIKRETTDKNNNKLWTARLLFGFNDFDIDDIIKYHLEKMKSLKENTGIKSAHLLFAEEFKRKITDNIIFLSLLKLLKKWEFKAHEDFNKRKMYFGAYKDYEDFEEYKTCLSDIDYSFVSFDYNINMDNNNFTLITIESLIKRLFSNPEITDTKFIGIMIYRYIVLTLNDYIENNFKKSNTFENIKKYIIEEFISNETVFENEINNFLLNNNDNDNTNEKIYEFKKNSNNNPFKFIELISEYTGNILKTKLKTYDLNDKGIIEIFKTSINEVEIKNNEQALFKNMEYFDFNKTVSILSIKPFINNKDSVIIDTTQYRRNFDDKKYIKINGAKIKNIFTEGIPTDIKKIRFKGTILDIKESIFYIKFNNETIFVFDKNNYTKELEVVVKKNKIKNIEFI